MSVDLKPRPVRPRIQRKRHMLASLGLPKDARWEQAAPILKDRIVMARLNHDDSRAALLSEVKAFLRRTLNRQCSCGAVIPAKAQSCRMCFKSRRRYSSQGRLPELDKWATVDWRKLAEEAHFNLKELSANCGISLSYIHTLFKRRYGKSFKPMTVGWRLEMIEGLFKRRASLETIAKRCGAIAAMPLPYKAYAKVV